MSNGVSFALVAGACCVVLFTASSTKNGSGDNATLNINSTGAKNVRIRMAERTRTYSSIPADLYNMLAWGGWLQNVQLLLVYDGNVYEACNSIHLYNDYSES